MEKLHRLSVFADATTKHAPRNRTLGRGAPQVASVGSSDAKERKQTEARRAPLPKQDTKTETSSIFFSSTDTFRPIRTYFAAIIRFSAGFRLSLSLFCIFKFSALRRWWLARIISTLFFFLEFSFLAFKFGSLNWFWWEANFSSSHIVCM